MMQKRFDIKVREEMPCFPMYTNVSQFSVNLSTQWSDQSQNVDFFRGYNLPIGFNGGRGLLALTILIFFDIIFIHKVLQHRQH